MKVDLYNKQNEVVGTAELPEACFGAPWKPALVHEVLRAMRANAREPWAHAKGRGEVRGGGKKPWRQKGTGRAQHGSIRSPIWKGGGKSHGPQKERDYSQKINKKAKRMALLSVLSKKAADHEIKVVDNLEFALPKTKQAALAARVLTGLPKNKKQFNLLIIRSAENKSVARAAANLPKTAVLTPTTLNVYDFLAHRHVLIEQRAIAEVTAHYEGAAPRAAWHRNSSEALPSFAKATKGSRLITPRRTRRGIPAEENKDKKSA